MAEKQVKSKKRVADHGEVFTAEREVNAMLDLVKDETERIDSRFLEPACGEGAFLIKVLERKLNVVIAKYSKSEHDFEKQSIIALTSLYGIDILTDNAKTCRTRLYDYWNKIYTKYCKKSASDTIRETARYILEKNILIGNALSLKLVDEHQQDTKDPIVFAEWTFVTGDKVQRRNYRLDVMLEAEGKAGTYKPLSLGLFDEDAGSSFESFDRDPITNEIIPKPLKIDYPLINYWEVQNYDQFTGNSI